MEGLSKFEEAVLKNIFSLSENDEFCDLEVQCCDGSVSVQGLVMAAICPNLIKSSCVAGFDSQYILLPDIYCHEFLFFLRTLLNPALQASIKENLIVLQKVTSTLGLDVLPTLSSGTLSSLAPDDAESEEFSMDLEDDEDPAATESEVQETILVDTTTPTEDLKGTRFIDHLMVDPSAKYSDLDSLCILLENSPAAAAAVDRKCLLNLGKVDIDEVGDEILAQNFCDQEGRLVCLVCYKIMGPSEFKAYREHVRGHDVRQLEKISIIMPNNISRGGPGWKKKFLSDAEIDEKYLEAGEDKLKCDKCTKKFSPDDKTAFRKHLQYHSGKEKNYVYLCTECPKEFKDPSNLKRHLQSVHEKQLFRCLHCDFEDRRKQKLEDHLLSVHKDKVWVYDEVSLNKGQEVLSELTEPLPPLNTGQPLHVADNPYIYKCSACSFKKRRLEDTEDHIKLFHDSTASIKKIALKLKDLNKKQYPCEHCNQVFSKLNVLNQHKFRVHDIALGSEFMCSICQVQCANKPGLRAHERTHMDKKYSCSVCNKSFLVLNLLRDHVDKGVCKIDHRTCQVCKKVFVDKQRKDIHMKIHTNEKPFKCSLCGKRFTQKRSLKEHCLTHDPVRHFECKICLKKFVQKNHLKYHLSSQHPSLFPEESKHCCDLCAKSFPFLHQLKRHLRIHGSTRGTKSSLRCPSCSNWFSSPTILRSHTEHCHQFPDPGSIVEPDIIVADVETFDSPIDIVDYTQ